MRGSKGWNGPTTPEFGLPTETWREVVARRERCEELQRKLKAGEVHSINDLITLNLDICQFAEDVIANCEGSELLLAFWKAIQNVSVLDPTCGSGAFLFAALNILEPLYEACLERMRGFVEEERLPKSSRLRKSESCPVFRKVLQEADDTRRHPKLRYFVLKSIILNNLYGVDIMEEAVEICKLRLFLSLVAQVETAQQVEPLPDIDFNIRSGNTLVGFATLDEVKRSLLKPVNQSEAYVAMPGFGESEEVDEIVQAAKYADAQFHWFHELQTDKGVSGSALTESKQRLRQSLDSLDAKLDHYLAGEYGIDPKKPAAFAKWKTSHQPFHWFAEFYGIMTAGGFDVIIGNPPWKEYAAAKKDYTVRGYVSEPCGNLHCLCTERCMQIRNPMGCLSFIVQLPMVSSSRMAPLRRLLSKASATIHVVPFDDRPGKLFEGLQNCRSVIFLSHGNSAGDDATLFTTKYQRWSTDVRENLFAQIEFARLVGQPLVPAAFPKNATECHASAFRRLTEKGTQPISEFCARKQSKHFIFYQEATRYWVKATFGIPYYAKNGSVGAPAHGRYLFFSGPELAHPVCAILNSSLFYAFFIAYGDCFHLSDTLASGFPISAAILADESLIELSKRLMKDLREKADRKTINTKAGDTIAYDEFYAGRSKSIIDDIDLVLAKHYGFTDEELDFIINYDIKYRLGQDSAEGEDP